MDYEGGNGTGVIVYIYYAGVHQRSRWTDYEGGWMEGGNGTGVIVYIFIMQVYTRGVG